MSWGVAGRAIEYSPLHGFSAKKSEDQVPLLLSQ